MLLAIDSRLSVPPSRPLVFRDCTLVAKVFHHMDVVSTCPFEEWDHYAVWFRRYGLFDFVDALVRPNEVEADIEIEDGRLDESTLAAMVATLSRFSSG